MSATWPPPQAGKAAAQHPGHPGLLADGGDHAAQCRPPRRVADRRGEFHRPIESRPEATGQHFVGLPGEAAYRVAALARRANAERKERDRDDRDHAKRRDRGQDRAP
jgi:hypothetical protein